MTDKNDEMVMVIPRIEVRALGLPGVKSESANPELYAKFDSCLATAAEFKRRGDVETDPTFVQIIPYCVVLDISKSETRILVYNRGSKAGERRLADKCSLGVGGHIQEGDVETGWRGTCVVGYAALRELAEELVGFDIRGVQLGYVGLFHNTDSPVNAVHLGVTYQVRVIPEDFTSMGDGIAEYRWVTPEELNDYALEGWSETVRDHFLDDMLAKIKGAK